MSSLRIQSLTNLAVSLLVTCWALLEGRQSHCTPNCIEYTQLSECTCQANDTLWHLLSVQLAQRIIQHPHHCHVLSHHSQGVLRKESSAWFLSRSSRTSVAVCFSLSILGQSGQALRSGAQSETGGTGKIREFARSLQGVCKTFARSLQGIICQIRKNQLISLHWLKVSWSTWQSTWHWLNRQVINPTAKVLLMELGTSFLMLSSAEIRLKLYEDR